MAPKILVGTGTWGHNYGIDQVRDQISQLDKLDCQQIDSAALYPFTYPGVAETLLGEIGYEGILVDTKVMWFDGGNNTLTVNAVQKSMTESLQRLKAKKVDSPILTTLEASKRLTNCTRSTSYMLTVQITSPLSRNKPPLLMPCTGMVNARRRASATFHPSLSKSISTYARRWAT